MFDDNTAKTRIYN